MFCVCSPAPYLCPLLSAQAAVRAAVPAVRGHMLVLLLVGAAGPGLALASGPTLVLALALASSPGLTLTTMYSSMGEPTRIVCRLASLN